MDNARVVEQSTVCLSSRTVWGNCGGVVIMVVYANTDNFYSQHSSNTVATSNYNRLRSIGWDKLSLNRNKCGLCTVRHAELLENLTQAIANRFFG